MLPLFVCCVDAKRYRATMLCDAGGYPVIPVPWCMAVDDDRFDLCRLCALTIAFEGSSRPRVFCFLLNDVLCLKEVTAFCSRSACLPFSVCFSSRAAFAADVRRCAVHSLMSRLITHHVGNEHCKELSLLCVRRMFLKFDMRRRNSCMRRHDIWLNTALCDYRICGGRLYQTYVERGLL